MKSGFPIYNEFQFRHRIKFTYLASLLACWLPKLAFWLVESLAGWLAWRLAGWIPGWLTNTCSEAFLFKVWVCWQLMNFLALPYIYSLWQPIKSQHFNCSGWPIRSLDYEWEDSGFLLVSLSIKVWVTLGQCLSLCLTIEATASISKIMQCIAAIWWHFQEAGWSI